MRWSRSWRLARPATASVAAIAAIATIAVTDNWRVALLAGAASAAVASTRVRYSGKVAIVLLALVALLEIGGHSIGDDPPPGTSTASPGKR